MKEISYPSKWKIKIKEGKSMGGELEGLTFCFTGKLETMKRAEAEQMVRDHGGESKSGVVKDLSYLVTNSTELLETIAIQAKRTKKNIGKEEDQK